MLFRRAFVLAAFVSSVLFSNVWGQELAPHAKVVVQTETRGLPSALLRYEEADLVGLLAATLLKETTPVPFTGLAIGWTTENSRVDPALFHFDVRTQTESGVWTEPTHLHGETAPDETPSGIYWTQLYVTPDGGRHGAYEITVRVPEGTRLTSLRVSVADASYPGSFPITTGLRKQETAGTPVIIPRSDWWGNLPPNYLNPTNYEPRDITITHALVHHTAGQNNPLDPPQVVRNIWDFHVNSRGFSDIGYNFLIDQFGNIYQGRYNPWLLETDVHGAHAVEANSKSVGISLLGQFHPPEPSPPAAQPDERALRSLEQVIAWRFVQRNLDPLSSATLATQWGPTNLPRISGHRNARATACPGDNLYNRLPTIRTNVNGIITTVEPVGVELPERFVLRQNYPNPFNPSTTIQFDVAEDGFVKLTVFDALGREIQTLAAKEFQAGSYLVRFDATGLPSGVYFYTLSAGELRLNKMMMLLR